MTTEKYVGQIATLHTRSVFTSEMRNYDANMRKHARTRPELAQSKVSSDKVISKPLRVRKGVGK